jgi:hypothetical protein
MIRRSNKKPGILYILLVELEGKSLVKIGVTHRTIEDRVVEILTSIFKKYREFPYCRPKRFKVTTDIYGKEKILHRMFEDKKYKTAKKFSGHTEFFDMPLEEAVAAYEKLLITKGKPAAK